MTYRRIAIVFLRFPSTGNRKLDWAILAFGFFLFVMKVVSAFNEKDP
jgi:hypothetical protein